MPIVVDHNAMAAASDDLSSDANMLQAALDELDSKIKVLAANWEGDAQQSYLIAKGKWTEVMTGVRQTLNSISTLLSQTNDTFRSIDQQGAAMWS